MRALATIMFETKPVRVQQLLGKMDLLLARAERS